MPGILSLVSSLNIQTPKLAKNNICKFNSTEGKVNKNEIRNEDNVRSNLLKIVSKDGSPSSQTYLIHLHHHH